MSATSITVTVVYSAEPRQVYEHTVQMQEQGATVALALQVSGLAAQVADIISSRLGVGIWGKRAALDHPLRSNDRVEVYRALTVDPKVARRERFMGQGAKKAAGLFAKRRDGAKAGY